MYERLVIVTQKTRLEGLIERFNTKGQARFYIEHAGGNFDQYEEEHDRYHRALDTIRQNIDFGLAELFVERRYVPTMLFSTQDVIITVGRDGLVANTATYVGSQPIVAINPDPLRNDGILLPFAVDEVRQSVASVLEEQAVMNQVTLAEATLQDGQRLKAFNEVFVGVKSHTSARYRLRWAAQSEPQSSSGIIVSTGAGSTGWLSSTFTMAAGIYKAIKHEEPDVSPVRLNWDDPRLFFVVREPFTSKHSRASLVAGLVEADEHLQVESLVPSGGVIFSDGIEADYLAFDAGAVVTIAAAAQRACLVGKGNSSS